MSDASGVCMDTRMACQARRDRGVGWPLASGGVRVELVHRGLAVPRRVRACRRGTARAGGTGARRGLGRGCVPGASLGIKPPVYVVMAVPGVEFELEGIKAVGAPGREVAAYVAGDEKEHSPWQSRRGRSPVRMGDEVVA